jgi:hypothetical protein
MVLLAGGSACHHLASVTLSVVQRTCGKLEAILVAFLLLFSLTNARRLKDSTFSGSALCSVLRIEKCERNARQRHECLNG